MNFDEWENYLDMQRELRRTPREREIQKELDEVALKHKRAYEQEIAPLMDEMARLEAAKPPLPIRLENGMVFEYVGPR